MNSKEKADKANGKMQAIGSLFTNHASFSGAAMFPVNKTNARKLQEYEKEDLSIKFNPIANEESVQNLINLDAMQFITPFIASIYYSSTQFKYCKHQFSLCTLFKIQEGIKIKFKCKECTEHIVSQITYVPLPESCYFNTVIVSLMKFYEARCMKCKEEEGSWKKKIVNGSIVCTKGCTSTEKCDLVQPPWGRCKGCKKSCICINKQAIVSSPKCYLCQNENKENKKIVEQVEEINQEQESATKDTDISPSPSPTPSAIEVEEEEVVSFNPEKEINNIAKYAKMSVINCDNCHRGYINPNPNPKAKYCHRCSLYLSSMEMVAQQDKTVQAKSEVDEAKGYLFKNIKIKIDIETCEKCTQKFFSQKKPQNCALLCPNCYLEWRYNSFL